MRWTQTLIPTLKENPQEAQIKSHRLMLRAGLIRKLASGTYSYLPLGLRALKKAEAIVREEMDRAGGVEVLMPAIHPAEIWKESGRLEIMGEDMIHFTDRHKKENVLGPTHEEIITDLVRREIHSYKQLPITLYQIQTKFRDEMRPRSGIIRSREFLMKDAYSFHACDKSLDETYQRMKETYQTIFTRCGLDFFIVEADPGTMGGSGSQEFVLFSDAGEDWMVQYGDTEKVVSVEMAKRKLKNSLWSGSGLAKKFKKVKTPGHSSVEGVATFLKKKPEELVKTMIYEAKDPASGKRTKVFAVLVRGEHDVSDFKVREKEPGAALATAATIEEHGSSFGFSGPLGLKGIPFYVDEEVLSMKNFVVGANEDAYHLVDFNLADIQNDDPERKIVAGDFRQAIEGDQGEINGKEVSLRFRTAIELGHIFKLNLRYSVPMKANFLDSSGKDNPVVMGCYGIGVNRILAAAIEQCADDKGIVWPKSISPYQVHVILIDSKDAQSRQIAESLEKNFDALVDDRDETAGVKFNDADLIGIPLRVILGPKNLKNGKAEIKIRKTGEQFLVDLGEFPARVLGCLDKLT